MDTSILFIKILALGYCLFSYVNDYRSAMALLLTFSLVVLALGVLIPALKPKAVKLGLILTSLALILVIHFTFPLMLLLVPILLVELFVTTGLTAKIGIPVLFALLPLSWVYGIFSIYTLLSGFCMTLTLLARKEQKLKALQKQSDALSLLNDRLNKKLKLSEDLKQQWTYTAQLEERNKIAQEIHDKVGHSISGSLMQLEAIKLLALSDPKKTSSMLDTVIQTLRGGLESIRLTLRNIKPPSEQMGLNRLQLMLDEFHSKHGIMTSLTFEGDISRISPLIWKILYENVTEGLTNLLRHSKADQVSVSLFVMNRMIRLQMNDNGLVYGSVKKGLGLSGMEERLFSVGGQLIVDISKGFSLSMLIPIKGDNHGNSASVG